MDDSVFVEDDDGSDFGPSVPKPPKNKASESLATVAKRGPKPETKRVAKDKPAPKKTTQTTLKSKPKSKKRPKSDSENEDEDEPSLSDASILSTTPPKAKKARKAVEPKKMGSKPLQEIENEAINEAINASMVDGSPAKPKKGSKSTDQYQKLTQLEHIIKRPDTYIGSVEMQDHKMWVYNSELESMEMRTVNFVPGLYKIFDEILVNAADNKQRDKNMDTVKVTIDRESGQISIYNNGRGIPIEVHEKEKIFIPEMIFGHLLTSSNYDDEEQKVTGGRNGYGAKLCNIFSTSFSIDTADSKTKKKYKQTWTANMSKMATASITQQKGDDYTKITFTPDYRKFKMQGIDDDFEALAKRRVYDLAGTVKGVKVWLNGERIKISNFKKYMEMYTKAIKRERGEEAINDTSDIITDSPDARWEIGFAVSDGTFQQVSFVNSIATTTGGTHVNYIADQVSNKLLEVVKKRKNNKVASLKTSQIRNHIFIFVNCLIVNPAFTSQTKEQLTTKHSQFGSKCNLSEDFLRKIAKTEVIENILHFAEQKADQILKKSDGSRRSRMDNPKLTDANRAGTKDGHSCTLILTEGDSAKGLAIAGRSVVSPDLIGVYPLRGKLLNVRDASIDQISKNQEIQNIKNFLGLKHKQTYTDCKSMRYGHLMIMTDQDHDGSHIKGLLINFFQVHYPSLLKIQGFLVEFITPIVKVYKGDPKHPKAMQTFFTMPEYEAFKEAHKGERSWEHKYYKGLGTSTTLEAQVYFRDLDKHLKEFRTMRDNEVELIELAFSKKKADERKEWLRQFKHGTYLDHSERLVSYTDFINKELILFSVADNMRSIPSVVDGLKPGQRKVLYTCFRRNLKKDMKVVELAGAVSGLTAYQHGDTSLQGTIVGLAQNFVGSNNVNCLEPSGNFGSRLQGGSDCASARYIYTRLSPFARKIFHPADEPLLTYNTDDEKTIEPEVYVPVVPMVLLNGADGIGTGWSTSIPNYNPEDVVENLMLMMDGEPMKPMTPWFRDFKGAVTQIAPDRFKFSGIINQANDNEIEITELPVRVWTQDFKDKIVDIIKAEKTPSWIKDYDDYNTHKDVHFVIKMEDKHIKIALEEGLEEKFKLTKTMATSNLVAFDAEARISRYANVEDIMKEFFAIRIKFYEKRKAHQLSELHKDLEKFSNQARFVQMIVDGKLIVSKKRKAILVEELKEKGFKPIPKVITAQKETDVEPAADNEEEEQDTEVAASAFDYLLGMPIWSLTKERVEKLLKQIGEVEEAIDTLIKLSKEDLWKRDLTDFIEEWRFQLEDDRKSQRKVANMGRRASSKIKVGAAIGRKRKVQDGADSDFDDAPKAKKAAVPKVRGGLLGDYFGATAPSKPPSQKTKGPSQAAKNAQKLLGMLDDNKSAPKATGEDKEDIWMQVDGAAPKAAQSARVKAPAPMKKALPTKAIHAAEDKSAEEDIVRPAISRKPRAAAAKPAQSYKLDDSDSDGDDMLLDVGNMVKGIPTNTNESNSSRPLFAKSASRPSSSHGFSKRPTSVHRQAVDLEIDDTDYSRLAPPTAKKGTAITARSSALSEDDESLDDMPVAKAANLKTARPKAEPKARAAPATKKNGAAPATALPKKAALSPAGKAYAAKKAKAEAAAKSKKDDSDIDDAVDRILDDEEEDDAPAVRRPARRAAAAAAPKAKWVVSDEEEEDDEESDDFDGGDSDD
ncbi:DNA topoisomerase 2 [Bacidia gigantensis]|uniref:DNA topoisomerase 2 n=1 Tax=Bacidia gigantensis TaxID=2732470 RepID=UPI001D051FC6|nr:DNA topoisomerase 2 [Bacidia gigantensis]KAG8528188.1 DNA topoisomerase 2 [Bacidia gigantensis]